MNDTKACSTDQMKRFRCKSVQHFEIRRRPGWSNRARLPFRRTMHLLVIIDKTSERAKMKRSRKDQRTT